ncbi:MAG: GIY-YIG nuclease family protein [Patescibacteria group bacterium]|nr:GIY-YIG nuclease family protein [Patescibacteria group bacterium]MDD4304148.1 GIY-YIG nuclease family protein [Patescibacteria group bacterium]MDD4695179.1 GIY-YIG nuclease family protein [Patescibacteria group bacterium]
MFYIYIIQSINFKSKFYTGFSKYLKNRLNDHNRGISPYTNKFRPWKLIYYCVFLDKKKALDFERYLKTASGIAFRNKRLI